MGVFNSLLKFIDGVYILITLTPGFVALDGNTSNDSEIVQITEQDYVLLYSCTSKIKNKWFWKQLYIPELEHITCLTIYNLQKYLMGLEK